MKITAKIIIFSLFFISYSLSLAEEGEKNFSIGFSGAYTRHIIQFDNIHFSNDINFGHFGDSYQEILLMSAVTEYKLPFQFLGNFYVESRLSYFYNTVALIQEDANHIITKLAQPINNLDYQIDYYNIFKTLKMDINMMNFGVLLKYDVAGCGLQLSGGINILYADYDIKELKAEYGGKISTVLLDFTFDPYAFDTTVNENNPIKRYSIRKDILNKFTYGYIFGVKYAFEQSDIIIAPYIYYNYNFYNQAKKGEWFSGMAQIGVDCLWKI